MMKVYKHDRGVILVGKAWQVRTKLKEYQQSYYYLSDWIKDHPHTESSSSKKTKMNK